MNKLELNRIAFEKSARWLGGDVFEKNCFRCGKTFKVNRRGLDFIYCEEHGKFPKHNHKVEKKELEQVEPKESIDKSTPFMVKYK